MVGMHRFPSSPKAADHQVDRCRIRPTAKRSGLPAKPSTPKAIKPTVLSGRIVEQLPPAVAETTARAMGRPLGPAIGRWRVVDHRSPPSPRHGPAVSDVITARALPGARQGSGGGTRAAARPTSKKRVRLAAHSPSEGPTGYGFDPGNGEVEANRQRGWATGHR